jgi:hypothetical protein
LSLCAQLHYKYNRNLIGDSDQEMASHLRKRSFNARKYSQMALQAEQRTSDSPTGSTYGAASSDIIASIYTRQVLKLKLNLFCPSISHLFACAGLAPCGGLGPAGREGHPEAAPHDVAKFSGGIQLADTGLQGLHTDGTAQVGQIFSDFK